MILKLVQNVRLPFTKENRSFETVRKYHVNATRFTTHYTSPVGLFERPGRWSLPRRRVLILSVPRGPRQMS